MDGYASSPRATNARTCRREHLPGLLVQVGDGGVNCVGSWSCVRRAGIPRSLLSPPGEAPWPSVPMDHGVQRRERGGGQAGGPAARPDLAVPSAAAVPREISTCSASLLFGLSDARPHLPRAVPLPVFFDAFSARPARGYAAAGRRLPRLPPVRRRNHRIRQGQPSHAAQPVVVRRPRLPRHAPGQRTVMAAAGALRRQHLGVGWCASRRGNSGAQAGHAQIDGRGRMCWAR